MTSFDLTNPEGLVEAAIRVCHALAEKRVTEGEAKTFAQLFKSVSDLRDTADQEARLVKLESKA